MTIDRAHIRTWFLTVFSILSIGALTIFFNGGVGVGSSNHVGLTPVVRRILDGNYLPGDFGISVRFYHHRIFAHMVAAFSAGLGEDRAFILLAIIGMTLLAAGLFVLCRALNLSYSGFLAVGLFVAAKLAWTGLGLEQNNFVGDMEAMPPTFAHALMLFAIASLLRSRYILTGLFAGLALLIHLQIGLTFALLLLPFFATRLKTIQPRVRAAAVLLFLAAAAAGLIHLIQMLRAGLADSSFTFDYINFRHPHHFELLSTAAAVWVTAHLLVQLGCYYRLRSHNREEKRAVGVLTKISLMIAALCLLHFLDYKVLQIGPIAKMQFLRLSPMITVFGAISLAVTLNAWQNLKMKSSYPIVNTCLLIVAAVWSGYYLKTHPNDYYFGVKRYAEQKSSWVDVCRWVKEYGPADTIYITPPDRSGFTYLTNRSTVVEFKINPDGGLYLTEWYERLRDVCGGTLPNARGFDNYPLLRKKYGALSADQLITLAAKYGAKYAVLPSSSQAAFGVLYQNKDYRLVKIPGE